MAIDKYYINGFETLSRAENEGFLEKTTNTNNGTQKKKKVHFTQFSKFFLQNQTYIDNKNLKPKGMISAKFRHSDQLLIKKN